MIETAATERMLIVGAGSSGLAVAKNFLEHGILFDCVEREDDVGGNWYYGRPASSVYRSTHLISSKRLTEYTDYPMPAEYPEYPSQQQAWEYLKCYARHFKLYESITFNTSVERLEPADGESSGGFQPPEQQQQQHAGWKPPLRRGWQAKFSDGRSARYRGVVICNGHNWDPKWPELPGRFDGLSIHSADYKTPDVLAGRRVLVVGAGNSGCDIAVESAQHTAVTLHSVRRGYHYLPKFLLGKPIDECGERLLNWRLPLWLRRAITKALVRLSLGPPWRVGLAAPDHRLFEAHPIINSQLYYYLGHGRIRPKPDVAELLPTGARFVDGSEEQLDVIVYATGFKISFPFVDTRHLNVEDGRPTLYLNVFHPTDDGLFVAGLIQPDSGQWGLVDLQAKLIAQVLRLETDDPAAFARFQQLKRQPKQDLGSGIRYLMSSRHLLEVEHHSYRRRLQKMIEQFSSTA